MSHTQQINQIDIGPQYDDDSAFVARCRLQQSLYRARVLREPCGVGPRPNSSARYGSMLVDGEKSGSNFVSQSAFHYALQRARDRVICNELTLEEYRLFNNMLSSMPLCFNLFADLRALLLTDERACTQAVKALFCDFEWIDAVLYIGVEFIPVPTERYIDDKTAFDAFIVVKDARGRRGLIAVETKYTDLLGNNTSKENARKDDIVQKDKLFTPALVQKLTIQGYSQLYRNFLLTYAYAKCHKMAHWASVTISPQEDYRSKQEIAELAAGLTRYQENVHKIDLNEFVERGILSGVTSIASVYQKVKTRYLPSQDTTFVELP